MFADNNPSNLVQVVRSYLSAQTSASSLSMEGPSPREEPTRTQVTASQMEALVSIMEEKPEIAGGKFSSGPEGSAAFRRKWQNYATRLNNLGPTVKTVKQWIATWKNMKAKARRDAARFKKESLYMGGEAPKPIDSLNQRILNLIPHDAFEGVEDMDFDSSASWDNSFNGTATYNRNAARATDAVDNKGPVQTITVHLDPLASKWKLPEEVEYVSSDPADDDPPPPDPLGLAESETLGPQGSRRKLQEEAQHIRRRLHPTQRSPLASRRRRNLLPSRSAPSTSHVLLRELRTAMTEQAAAMRDMATACHSIVEELRQLRAFISCRGDSAITTRDLSTPSEEG